MAKNFVPLRHQIYSRYATFFQNLLKSSSKEVVLLANIVSRDAQSVTAKNIALVDRESGCSPWDYSSMRVKSGLKRKPIVQLGPGPSPSPSFGPKQNTKLTLDHPPPTHHPPKTFKEVLGKLEA